MSDNTNIPEKDGHATQGVSESVDTTAGSARRRILKKGVVLAPVVLTLTSRPVLAWHCKSPSAWGSEQLDSATSLATNDGHRSYSDETWTISNWKDNSSRAGLGKPWEKLGFNDNQKDKDKYWKKLKLKDVQAKGVVLPRGVNADMKMVDFLGGNGGTLFQKTIVVAQLNARLIPSVRQCITPADLQRMASGTYSPPHVSVVWHEEDIVKYLQLNYIAVQS